jgi:hypothetical protein
MPAYNFQGRFAQLVADGVKPHTIRPRRKRPTVVGDTLYLYTGMRTRNCRLLRTETCTAVTSIDIGKNVMGEDHVLHDGRFLDRAQVEWLARADGFDSVEAFFAFFRDTYGRTHGPTFRGELIAWQP